MRPLRLLIAGPLVSACAGGAGVAENTIDRWLGPTYHLKSTGALRGEEVAFDRDEASLGDLHCLREYQVPGRSGALDYGRGRLVEVRLNGYVDMSEGPRYLELELKQHNFQNEEPGARTTVVARVSTETPGPRQMWLEWEWHDSDSGDTKLYEEAAVDGAFTLGEMSGTRSAESAVIPEGEGDIGGFFQAEWSSGARVEMSFFLPCRKNHVELVE